MARQAIYVILMAFEDTLLGRHVSTSATPADRRRALSEFVGVSLERLVPGLQRAGT